jgi:hypothetical protein
MSDSTDTNPVSAVPSGSAGEPTPTTADRLAALRQHPEVAMAAATVMDWGRALPNTQARNGLRLAVDALLSAVAAAATAQTEALMCEAYDAGWYARCQDDWRDAARDTALALIREQATVRALAGGAPQGVSDAPTDDCPGCSHAKTLHGDTGCDAPYCRCRAMAGHFDA